MKTPKEQFNHGKHTVYPLQYGDLTYRGYYISASGEDVRVFLSRRKMIIHDVLFRSKNLTAALDKIDAIELSGMAHAYGLPGFTF